MKITAAQLAALVNGEIVGDASVTVSAYSKIEEAKQGSLSFLANPKYTHFVYETEASVLLVKKDFVPEQPVKSTLVKVDDPYATLALLLEMVSKTVPDKKGIEQPAFISESVPVPDDAYIGAFAYIGTNVKLGKGVKIYPQCYIGDNVTVGERTILYSGVKVYSDCRIGDDCILHSGAVVGSDGFGFAPEQNGGYRKIAQIGNVIIENNVEIGANTTIDRATMGATIIRQGTKLDNLIQIAHNVEVGENNVMAAQSGIAGSTKIGKHNMVGGQVGFAGHIRIGDCNQIGAQSGIHTTVGDNKILMGYPAIDARLFMKQAVYSKRMGEMFSELNRLKKEMTELKK